MEVPLLWPVEVVLGAGVHGLKLSDELAPHLLLDLSWTDSSRLRMRRL